MKDALVNIGGEKPEAGGDDDDDDVPELVGNFDKFDEKAEADKWRAKIWIRTRNE